MTDGIPTCPECGGSTHLESSAYGRAWTCDRRAGVGDGCQGAIQISGDDELTELQIAELIARQTRGNATEAQQEKHLGYRDVIDALEAIAKSGYLSNQQRGVLQKARAVVERLADAAALAKDQEGREERAGEAAMEKRFQQAMGLLGPSLAPDSTRLEASVIDLLALARFGADGCSPAPDILAHGNLEELDNDLRRRAMGEHTPIDVMFSDLVSAHQRLREAISRDWSARSEPIEDLHAGFITALPGLREGILASPPTHLQMARRLIDETTSDNVVPLASRRTQ